MNIVITVLLIMLTVLVGVLTYEKVDDIARKKKLFDEDKVNVSRYYMIRDMYETHDVSKAKNAVNDLRIYWSMIDKQKKGEKGDKND